ncbi:MAG: serine/threonine protein kinase [Planctomycetes bacterium]|nr:serine/threonine protein kinase [Planctomycetota bacterium]
MRTRDVSFENDPVARMIEACLDLPVDERDRGFLQLIEEHPEHRERITTQWRMLREAGLLEEPGSTDHDGFPERLGPYVLERRLGAGGMGVVYQAHETGVDRRVALKIIRPEFAFFEGSRRRFEREIDAIARLQHENIVPLYAAGEQNGVSYLAMPYVEGANLADLLQRLASNVAPSLPRSTVEDALRSALEGDAHVNLERLGETWLAMALEITRQVAEALEHAHGRAIVHRDVKPQNVILGPRGNVLLLDFGLARQEDASRMTASGAALGSLAYMSPEQVRGDVEAIGPRSDVYGLGALLHELLCGSPPYDAKDSNALRQAILDGNLVPIRKRVPELSRDVDAVLATALAREPARRYASAGAFVRDLTALLEGRPVAARSPSFVQRIAHWISRHPTTSVAAALVFFVGPIVYGVQAHLANQRTSARERIIREDVMGMLHETYRDLANVPGDGALRRSLVERARRTLQALGELDSTTPLHLERATIHAFLGEVASETDAVGARAEYEHALASWNAFLEGNGDHRKARFDRDMTRLRLANALEACGLPDRARATRAAAFAGLETLAAEDPEDRPTRLALVDAWLARARADTSVETARDAAIHAEAICRELLVRDDTDRLAGHDLALCLLRSGALDTSDESLARLHEARRIALHLVRTHPAERAHRRLLADGASMLAHAYLRRGDRERARNAWDEADRTLARLVAMDPSDRTACDALAGVILMSWRIRLGEPMRSSEVLPQVRYARYARRLASLAPSFLFADEALAFGRGYLLQGYVTWIEIAEQQDPAGVALVTRAWFDELARALAATNGDAKAHEAWGSVMDAHLELALDSLGRCRSIGAEAPATVAEMQCVFPRLEPIWNFVQRFQGSFPRLVRHALDRALPFVERGRQAFPDHSDVLRMHATFRLARGLLGKGPRRLVDLLEALASTNALRTHLDPRDPGALRELRATEWRCLTALARNTPCWPPVPFAFWGGAQVRALEGYERTDRERGDAASAASVAWALDTAWPSTEAMGRRALEFAERARKLAGEDPDLHDVFHTLSALCERVGDRDDALRWQSEALARLERSRDGERIDLQVAYRSALERLHDLDDRGSVDPARQE